MKAILMSIKPEWCNKIFSGEKTIEVIKPAPKLKPPFKVYVYQTKSRLGNKIVNEALNAVYGSGKVVGEFVCDKMDYKWKSRFSNGRITSIKRENDLYITDPKRYDTPKELSEFLTPSGTGGVWGNHYLSRPPRSWMYVEEIEE